MLLQGMALPVCCTWQPCNETFVPMLLHLARHRVCATARVPDRCNVLENAAALCLHESAVMTDRYTLVELQKLVIPYLSTAECAKGCCCGKS